MKTLTTFLLETILFESSREIPKWESLIGIYGAWITPDGEYVPVGTMSHGKVAASLGKTYNFTQREGPTLSFEDSWRVPALDAGLIRVIHRPAELNIQGKHFSPEAQKLIFNLVDSYLFSWQGTHKIIRIENTETNSSANIPVGGSNKKVSNKTIVSKVRKIMQPKPKTTKQNHHDNI